MLKIRDSQLDAFKPSGDDEVLDFVVEHLECEHRRLVASIPPEDLREMAANGIRRARSHGFSTAADLAAFVAIMFVIAPNFDEHPAIRSALRDDSDRPGDRFDRVFDRAPDSAWAEAERDYDADAWLAFAGEDR